MRRDAFVRKALSYLFFSLTALLLPGMAGCGGSSSSSTPPAVGVTIATPAASSVDPGDSVTLTATASNSSAGVTWTLSGSGCSGAACGALSGVTTSSVTYAAPATPSSSLTVTVTATSVSDATKTASTTLSVPVVPAIATAAGALAGSTVGSAYSVTLTGTGGIAPYKWAVTSGSLPAGLSLGSTTGTISGTPTAAGSPGFTVTVTDSGTPTALTAQQSFSIAVGTPPAIVFGTPVLPNGTVGTAYSGSVSATGGAGGLTYALASGALPGGLQLNTATGAITGTPTGAAVSTFAVKATDAYGDTATSGSYSIATAYPALTVTTASLPNGAVGVAYSQTLAASGGAGGYTWSVTSGASSLTALGLSVSSGGVVSGSSPTQGSANFTVKVTDSANSTATANLSVTIYAGLTVTTASLPSADAGTAYSQTLAAAGGAGGYTWSVTNGQSSLTATGLSVSGAGVVSATTLVAGTASFTVKVTDSASNTATQTLSVTVNSALSITTTALPSGIAGTAYSQTLAAGGGGGGYTWSVTSGASSLSALGLSVSSGGVVSATSPTQGTASFTVKVTDSTGASTTQTYSVTINGALTITTGTLPSGTVNVAYSQTFAATGGAGGYTWSLTSGQSSVTALGLSFSTGGVLSGSGPSYGTANFTVKVTDSANNTASGTFSVTINYGSLTITTTQSGLGSATVNAAYSETLQASGGSGSYTWSLLSGQSALNNDNLSLSSGGTLSGTPSVGGSIPFVVQVKDTVTNNTANQSYSLTINAAATSYSVSGTIFSAANCGGTVQGATVSINTNPVITATTNSNGSFTLSNVPAGNWTLTPSYPGASAVFFPASQAVTVSSNTASQTFGALVSYTVSGTVSYNGSKTGQIYVEALSTNCSGNGAPGTSITGPGTYTLHGVGAPGSYTLQAFMDTVGNGALNAADPSGTASVTTGYANSTGVNITLADPGAVTLSSAPSISEVAPTNEGAVLIYNPIKNSNGTEQATGYTLQWSTSISFSTVAGSKSFAAEGTGTNVFFFNGLTDGSVYYFRLQGSNGSSTSPYSVVKGPVTIGAPTGGNAVSGSVTFPGTATGPLYVVLYSSTLGAYGQFIPTPSSSPQAFTIQAPSGSYQLVAVLDQDHNGIIDAGDLQNLLGSGNASGTSITVSGNTTGNTVTLSSAGASAAVSTQALYAVNNTVPMTYSLYFSVVESSKLPVSVQLVSGPNVVTPTDIATCSSGNNCSNGFKISFNTYGTSPGVGDTYTFNVTYSDGTTGTVTASVSAVLSGFATNLSPTTGVSTSTTPTFTWTDPANAANYLYQFSLNNGSTGGQLWTIPGEDSSANGFASTITSIPWNTDPTGGGSTPSVSSLTLGTNYVWQINVVDSNNNQAITQVQYQP
jgi:hypothetical protein